MAGSSIAAARSQAIEIRVHVLGFEGVINFQRLKFNLLMTKMSVKVEHKSYALNKDFFFAL